MKSILILLLFVNSCETNKNKTYKEALADCIKMHKEEKPGRPNPNCLIGAQIPDFETTSINGLKINKAQLKGNISILNFWFIECKPCIAEIPGFNAIEEKYGKEQINYIAIGKDDKIDIAEFLKKHPWKFQIIPNGNALINDEFKIIWGFPTTFLLNKEAEIIQAFSGGKTDSRAVQEVQDKLIPFIEKELK